MPRNMSPCRNMHKILPRTQQIQQLRRLSVLLGICCLVSVNVLQSRTTSLTARHWLTGLGLFLRRLDSSTVHLCLQESDKDPQSDIDPAARHSVGCICVENQSRVQTAFRHYCISDYSDPFFFLKRSFTSSLRKETKERWRGSLEKTEGTKEVPVWGS